MNCIVSIDQSLLTRQKLSKGLELHVKFRPPGGEVGIAFMNEDNEWAVISIDVNEYVSSNDRNLNRLRQFEGQAPLLRRGMTPYRFYKENSKEVITDYFSDDDDTVRRLRKFDSIEIIRK
jgi:hypothetical protein